MKRLIYSYLSFCWLVSILILLTYPFPYVPHSVSRITFYDKYAHIVFFGVLTYFLIQAAAAKNRQAFRKVAFFVFCAAVLLNIGAEYAQSYIPSRNPSFLDFLAGIIGTVAAILIVYALNYPPRPRILLQVCCAPCLTYVREALRDKYRITLFFYNPNIYPEEEYLKRRREVRRFALLFGMKFISKASDHEKWKAFAAKYGDEPEGGKRCELCFTERLEETAKAAKEMGFKYFATTLTMGPQKNAAVINDIGRSIGKEYGLKFIEADWKKNGGYGRSLEISRKMGLYRQNFCGCEYSARGRKKPVENR